MTVEKVLHILPMNQLSGAEKMALLICKHLTKYEPIVVTGGEVLKKVFEKEGIQAYSMNFSKAKLPLTLHQLKQTIKVHQIKLIHAHDNTATLAAYLTKRLYRLDVKIISHIHNCYPWLKKDSFNKKIDQWLRPQIDCNIACGERVTDYYTRYASYFPLEKTAILSNTIEISDVASEEYEIQKLKSKFGLNSQKKIIGFIGRLSEQKGLVPFIQEFAKHQQDFADCQFLLVGTGEQEQEINDLIKQLNLESYFILIGFQERTDLFYQLIDVFFLPSLYEGLPMAILEAMACKVPVISMEVGSIKELLQDNCGVLIEPNCYEEFCLELKRLKKNTDFQKQLALNGFNRVMQNYEIKTYRSKLQEIYDKVTEMN